MATNWKGLLAGIGAMALGAGLTALLTTAAVEYKDEQAIKQTEQTLKAPQVVRYPEHSITCFWWSDLKLIDCMPDYQLGTRKKYEG